MQRSSLTALARQNLTLAQNASSGRSAHTVYRGHEHVLRQPLTALTAGQKLDEHENPGEATVHVLHGRVRLGAGDTSWDGSPGDLLIVPDSRHTRGTRSSSRTAHRGFGQVAWPASWWAGGAEHGEGDRGPSGGRDPHFDPADPDHEGEVFGTAVEGARDGVHAEREDHAPEPGFVADGFGAWTCRQTPKTTSSGTHQVPKTHSR